MRLDDLEFIRLLPEFMQDDAANIGLSKAMDDLIRPLAVRLLLLTTWGHIDELPESELDELAWELDIQWYYLAKPGDLDTKRRLIRESDLVHARLGTPWAVEETVRAFFGSATVQEWNEYAGQPGYFRIATENPAIFYEERDKFLRILDLVKRKSSWYDGEIFFVRKSANIYAGVAQRIYIGVRIAASKQPRAYTVAAGIVTGVTTITHILHKTKAKED